MRDILTLIIVCACFVNISLSQQIADESFHPVIQKPEYNKGEGPVIYIDEGHHNFHTRDGRYKAFSNLLERDGYVVKPFPFKFEEETLDDVRILVISNALNEANVSNWSNPVYSAFTEKEIEVVQTWVERGGSLFLIADHMPMGGAAKDLAAAFDFEFTNGFAMDTLKPRTPAYFNRARGLIDNPLTRGRNKDEHVTEVATFTGQGFQIPKFATPILVFDDAYVNLLPEQAWSFLVDTPSHNLKGWSQGAFANFGKGRIVFFGEAAMFSAQVVGAEKIKAGMNRDDAGENYKLLLNIIHWLDNPFD
ncbi:MAG: DUF4350 domain-containing protein [Flavobacteriaceae bacterium]|nr:DUF4350 domain-containing protein [Flavobacteriaceae bacterium]